MTIVLGIDLATADARVLAVDAETGEHLAERSRPLEVINDGPRREQPARYAAVVGDLIAAVAHDLGARAAEVAALSLTGTSGTVVPTDAAGAPVANALLYNDPRGVDELASLTAAGLAERPSTALARTAWLQHNAPAERYLFTPDVVAAALAGRILAADTSHALKSGIDPAARAWNAPALDLLGVPRESLPDLEAPGRVIGTVSPSVAATLGLAPGVLIVSGMTDGSTSQIATGAVRIGDTVGVLGTTLVMKAVAETPITDAGWGIYSHIGPDGSFWPGGASNSGAGVLRTGLTAELDPREADARASALGPSPVVGYPLPAPGERFPLADASFAGFTVALDGSAATVVDPVVAFRAVLEGVAFVERLGLERLATLGVGSGAAAAGGRHHLGGGASSSRVWNTIRASALGREVVVPGNRSSAFGAAMLAVVGLSGDTLAEVAARLARPAALVAPDETLVGPLAERYAVFTAALPQQPPQQPPIHPANQPPNRPSSHPSNQQPIQLSHHLSNQAPIHPANQPPIEGTMTAHPAPPAPAPLPAATDPAAARTW